MKTFWAWAPVVMVAAVMCAAGEGQAQESAAAETLFNKGVAEMEAGNYPSGCPAVAESLRLEPRPGTLFTLADCEAKWGKAASAMAHFADYLRAVSVMKADERSRHADRRRMAEQRMRQLDATVPRLTLELAEGAPRSTVVKRDGVVVGEASLGMALPVDPGEHVVVTQVPGGQAQVLKVEIALRERKALQLRAASPAPRGEKASAPEPVGRRYGSAVLVTGGIGAAGLVVGTVTGLMAMSRKSTVMDNCTGTLCNAQGVDAGDSGRRLSDVATVGYGIGVVGLGTAAILWFAGEPGKERAIGRGWRPVVSTDGSQWARACVEGTW